MPVKRLIKSAKKAGLKPGSKRFKAYVYGTEQRIKALEKRKK